MHLNKIGMYQLTPGGICLQGETVSLKMEFAAENIFRMWTTLQDDFRQEETLVLERTDFDCPDVCVTEQDNLVMISTSKLTAHIHLEPFCVEVRDTAGKNRIFIKCSQFHNREAEVWSERAWGFYFTIVDENRKPMNDIVYCAE